ncbi:hypothetical protein M0R45_019028 [Rubus argutus]|uniref:Protein FAR1-RELATED SEQUENCE n=1 Tax=Rubus argutus TaxID=59490 RepID=A0AAW1X649_RUBAR
MSGKQPKTILTDQSAAMASAISEVFPQTHHRLCVWHIYQNATKQLSHVFHGSQQFTHDFGKCVYDYEDEEDWLLAWNEMLEMHNLKENKWLKKLFDVKEKWAFMYGRHTFTADMMSTQRSESMNNTLKKYLKPSHDLLRFFEHYERVLADRRYEELIADFKMMQTSPVLYADVEMLQHAEEVYTPKVFKLFQQQYKRIGDYVAKKVSKSDMKYEYLVSYRAEHEELTKYAHEYSIELLKNLEEKKKKLLKDKCLNQTSEHHDVVLGELPKACGVKRKATVRRPRGSGAGYGRYKGVLEGIKPISQVESYASRDDQNLSLQIIGDDPDLPLQDQFSFTQLLQDVMITRDDFSQTEGAKHLNL